MKSLMRSAGSLNLVTVENEPPRAVDLGRFASERQERITT